MDFLVENVYTQLGEIHSYKQKNLEFWELWKQFGENSRDDFFVSAVERQFSRIPGCGHFVQFAISRQAETARISRADFCRSRLCPLCQKRKSLRLYSNLCSILEPIKEDYRFIHLTLTVPNCTPEEAPGVISKLFVSSRKLFSHERVKKSFKGIFRALEVSYNSESKELHPHLHCLVLVNPSYFNSRDYISYSDIRELWGQFCGVDNPQVFLRKVDNLAGALNEVVKYSAKPFERKGESDEEFFNYLKFVGYALKGRRLHQCFGVVAEQSKKFHLQDLEEDEILEEAPEDEYHVNFEYFSDSREYVHSNPANEERKLHRFVNFKERIYKREWESLYKR